MYLFVMRHGETAWNRVRRVQGSSDIELSPKGVSMARETGRALSRAGISFEWIYSSPYKRALKTAQIIQDECIMRPEHHYTADKGSGLSGSGGCAAPIIQEPRIREMNFGKYEGMSIPILMETDQNMRNCFDHPSLYVPDPKAESFAELARRVGDFFSNEILPLERMHQDAQNKNILVVCHGAVIRAMLMVLLHAGVDSFWSRSAQRNCSLNLLRVEDGEISILREEITLSEIAHVVAEEIVRDDAP